MRTTRRRAARRGQTLIELMASLMLWTAFSVVAFRVVGGVFRTYGATRSADNAAARLDGAIAVLRADVGAATSADVAGDHALVVHAAGGDVRWASDGGTWSRAGHYADRRWAVGRPLVVAREGTAVLVRASADPADAIPMTVGGGR